MAFKSFLKKTVLYRLYRKQVDINARNSFERRNAYFKAEGAGLLKAFSRVLNENKIVFWLEFGSLLGYYREHDFIKHDLDLDVGMYLKDADKLRTILISNGFKLKREHYSEDGGREDTYIWKHTTIDIFYFRESNNSLFCNSFRLLKERRFLFHWIKYPCTVRRIDVPLFELKQTEYKGSLIYVPSDEAKHLIAHYGEHFMTPDPKFDCKQATNITYYTYDQMKGYRRYF